MEPKNFWKEMQRMCKQRGGTCDDTEDGHDCPLRTLPCCDDHRTIASITAANFAEAYTAVEKWSNEHPQTRQSEFLKAYPDAKISSFTGVIAILPCEIDKSLKNERCKKYIDSTSERDECAKDYWEEEVE